MSTSKIRIKMGEVEVEFEGSEAFLKDELKELLAGVVDLHKTAGIGVNPPGAERKEFGDQNLGEGSNGNGFAGTTNSVAAKLGGDSGPDLIIAAVARATLVLGQPTCSRTTITKEMQAATSYYKKTYTSNLSSYLKRLVADQKIREISKDTYALSATETQRVKATLVD